jgi:hypothetical protein
VPRLLERQAALLAHLTSPAAIFGSRRGRADARLAGLDRHRLHLEARFSHDKRMEKICAVLPKTFELLGSGAQGAVRGFAADSPPDDIGRLHNARQFHDFLRRRWKRRPPRRPYLADVAACELALAEVRHFAEDDPGPPIRAAAGRYRRIRRRPGIVLLRCRFDIRPIFEDSAARVVRRKTLLAVAVPSGADGPAVSELAPAVFELLAALDAPHRRAGLDPLADADGLLDTLTAEGLVEPCR